MKTINNENQCLVSFIIPCLNGINFIDRCFKSILAQTKDDWEIIVVDNGSTDGSLNRLNEYSKNDKRIHVVSIDIRDLGTARNTGIENANGKYLCFVDVDDFIENNLVELISKYETKDIFIFDYFKNKNGKKILRKMPFETNNLEQNEINFALEWICGDIKSKSPFSIDLLSTAWSKVYRRDLVSEKNIRFLPMNIIGCTEDVAFNIEYLLNCKDGYYINAPFYNYVCNNQSLTHKRALEPLLKLFDQFEIMSKTVEKYGRRELVSCLKKRMIYTLFSLFVVVSRQNCKHKEKMHILKQLVLNDYVVDAYKTEKFNNLSFVYKVFNFLLRKKHYRLVYFAFKIANLFVK